MAKRFILYSEGLGVFLGTCFGLCFWSKVDPVGQPAAITFASKAEVLEVVKAMHNLPDDWRIVEVEVSEPPYATVKECVDAGLPAWSV